MKQNLPKHGQYKIKRINGLTTILDQDGNEMQNVTALSFTQTGDGIVTVTIQISDIDLEIDQEFILTSIRQQTL